MQRVRASASANASIWPVGEKSTFRCPPRLSMVPSRHMSSYVSPYTVWFAHTGRTRYRNRTAVAVSSPHGSHSGRGHMDGRRHHDTLV